MPRGDRTGPQGMGPQTGRAAGFCAGYDMPGYANPGPGRGYGMGSGGGRGWRHWFHATGLPRWARFWGSQGAPQMTEEQEAGALKTQATWLGQQLEEIQRRLTELEK